MISELSAVLISVLSTSVVGTIVGTLLYWRQNKKLKNLEVEKAKIESRSDTWHLYDEQIKVANDRIKELLEVNREKESRLMEKDKWYNERIAEVEERFNKQTTYLRGVQRELNQSYAEKNDLFIKIGKQHRVIDHLGQWLCQRPWKDCQRRRPQQAVKPTKYVPLEDFVLDEYCKACEEAVAESQEVSEQNVEA